LLVKALSWVPSARARHLWFTTPTFGEVVAHCELPYIAYLAVTSSWDEAVEKLVEFAQAAEVVTALETVDFDDSLPEDREDERLAWELSYGTRLYVHPVDVLPVPSSANASEFFRAKSALQKARKDALALSGLIEWTPKGEIWHPLPSELTAYAKAELGLLEKPRSTPPRSGGRPPKLTDAQLIEAEGRWPGADDASLAKKLGVHRTTIIRVRRLARRSRRTRT